MKIQDLLAIGIMASLCGCENCADSEPESTDLNPPVSIPKPAEEEHHYFHKEEKPHAAEWSYTGDTSPSHWGDLNTDYALAKIGKEQSPVNIEGALATNLPKLEINYHPAKIDLVYNGHTVEEMEEKGSTLTYGKQTFELQQFHFHSPSEHTVDGRHFAMEMHLVHKSEAGKVAVLGVLIEEGESNAAFDGVWDYLLSDSNREQKADVTIDASTLLPENHQYYSYEGSFTTPPCTEGVLWMVMKNPVQLSKEQVEKFRAIINGNNRPIQPLNGRTVSISD